MATTEMNIAQSDKRVPEHISAYLETSLTWANICSHPLRQSLITNYSTSSTFSYEQLYSVNPDLDNLHSKHLLGTLC